MKRFLYRILTCLDIIVGCWFIQHDQAYHLQDHYYVCLSPEFSKEQKAIVIDGISVWNEFGETRFYGEVDGLCNVLVRPVVGIEAAKLEKRFDDPYLLGYADHNTNTIYIFVDKMWDNDDLRTLATHETAHWIGLNHVPMNKMAILNPIRKWNMIQRIYPPDIAEYCRHWSCKNVNVNEIYGDEEDNAIDAGSDIR